MKKKYSYKDCYHILNAKPNCNWDELRRAYKKSIQKWHPDRFKEGSNEKTLGNDKIKKIILAYNQIHAFYRENGNLPPTEPTPTNKPSSETIKRPVRTTIKAQKTHTKPIPKAHPKTPKSPLFSRFVFLTLVVSGYYIFEVEINSILPKVGFSNHEANILEHKENGSKKKILTKFQGQEKYLDSETKYFFDNGKRFTIGSSVGEVLSAQGRPTKTAGEIWFYNLSEVHFSNGKVIRWVRDINTPLKTHLKFNQ